MNGLFWDYNDLSAGSMHTGSSSDTNREPSGRIGMLEDRIDRLMLTSMAMWSLLREKTDLSEEDLMERVKQIDLMDGTADNRVTPHVAKCSACERPMSPRHPRCIYCGNERLIVSAFDTMVG